MEKPWEDEEEQHTAACETEQQCAPRRRRDLGGHEVAEVEPYAVQGRFLAESPEYS